MFRVLAYGECRCLIGFRTIEADEVRFYQKRKPKFNPIYFRVYNVVGVGYTTLSEEEFEAHFVAVEKGER